MRRHRNFKIEKATSLQPVNNFSMENAANIMLKKNAAAALATSRVFQRRFMLCNRVRTDGADAVFNEGIGFNVCQAGYHVLQTGFDAQLLHFPSVV